MTISSSQLSLRHIVRSAGFYPITLFYLAATAVVMSVAGEALSTTAGVFTLAFLALLAILFATYRELRTVRRLIDGQRTELIARIDELAALLNESGIEVPHPSAKGREARADEHVKELM